ncbi:intersectin-EH binding protein Ibp1 [Mycolicibacterium arenosum]|uniref:Intersectin-EH binding protein Ibp1 n=1 Tax=Mycolicibacterium arenosum TaxID=2952157 RepID=A0ABT1LWU8_9MYCO|nr:intersectin-EH binding protein Ibp1 [Mycolicibacterium sp. CAU 1645]MCP9271371.1 intersectin-EH binding protein Ibp1 [Mycolicibacterium sp. CAU 1645]
MAISDFSARRLVLAGGFALALAAAPAVAAFTAPAPAPGVVAEGCSGGEEADTFTGNCIPHTVPSSPFSSIPGNPDIPAIDGIPCTGANSGQCIGLAEDAPQYVPPTSSESNTPTATGSIG